MIPKENIVKVSYILLKSIAITWKTSDFLTLLLPFDLSCFSFR